MEGNDWESIFAKVIGAQWSPSNVGLDDVIFEQCAWGAKTVKNNRPSKAIKVRLISGRNSAVFSFGDDFIKNADPDLLGEKVLQIWNERVAGIRKKYLHLRTVVLLKSEDLLELAVFEFDTEMFLPAAYKWQWNENNNLQGYTKDTEEHKFTWQPHGSQFTVIESVPANRLAIRLKQPPLVDKLAVLESLQFDASWVEVLE